MIYVKWGDNKVVTTLSEMSVNLVNPYYTWKLTDKDSDEVYIFTATDNSYAPHYWNSFTFSVSDSFNPLQGEINIKPSTYTYEVYEMVNEYDLDLNNAVGLVETGLLTYNATYSPIGAYTQSNNNTTVVYRNQNRI